MPGVFESLRAATPKANVTPKGSGSVFDMLKGQIMRDSQATRESATPGTEILPKDLQAPAEDVLPVTPVAELPPDRLILRDQPEPNEPDLLLPADSVDPGDRLIEEITEDDVTPAGLRRLALDEGDILETYTDSVGVATIGVGFNLEEPANAPLFKRITGYTVDEAMKPGFKITKEQSQKLLAATVKRAESEAVEVFPNIDELPPEVQDALINFTFNLGQTRASQFNETRKAIADKDGKKAAAQLRKSLWYKQVKSRGERIAKTLETYLVRD